MDPYPRGPDWMPITPKTGSLFHAESTMSSAEFTAFLEQTLGPAAERCRDGAIAFVCMDWRHAEQLTAAGKVVFTELKSLRVE